MRLPLAPLVLLIPLLIAFLPDGLPNTADMPVHFIRAAEMVNAWRDGILLPRWSANLGYGYGIPLFNYAPPLPYLLTTLFHFIGLPLEIALKATVVVSLLVAAYGVYRAVYSPFGPLAAVVGTTAFLYAPYRLRELFIQGNVGQFMAWSFVPWAVWGVGQVYATRRWPYVVVVALALTGTLLSHNVVALVLGLILVVQTVGLMGWGLFKRKGLGLWLFAGQALCAALLGAGLAAWFSVPALVEGDFIALERIVASDYRTRFVPFTELVALSPPLDRAAINPYLPLTLGAVQVLISVVGLLLLMRPTTRRVAGVGFAALAFGAAGMAVQPSAPLWAILPFAELFEFPARWHGFSALGWAGLAGYTCRGLTHRNPRLQPIVAVVLVALLLGSALVNLYPHKLPSGTLQGDPAAVVAWEQATGAVGTTSLGEFTPRWRTLPLTTSPLVANYAAGTKPPRIQIDALLTGATVETLVNTGEFYQFRIFSPAPITVTANLLYFPGWQVTVDGVPLPPTPQAETGLIQFPIATGAHSVEVRLTDTPLRRVAEIISGLAWGGLVIVGLGYGVRQIRHGAWVLPKKSLRLRSYTPALTALGGILMPLLAYVLFPTVLAPISPPDQVRGIPTTLQADFGSDLRMLGIEPLPEVVSAGATLNTVVYLNARQDLKQDYALYLHLDDPSGTTVATIDQRHPMEIPTSAWPPALYLRATLPIVLPPDLPPMKYRLRLGFYNPATNERLQVNGANEAEIGQVWVESDALVKPRGPATTFGTTIHLRGAEFEAISGTLTLYWQTEIAQSTDYAIFVHLLDAQGQLITQADGVPFDNRYRVSEWRAGQMIVNRRQIGNNFARVIVGVYDPRTGARLTTAEGGDAWIVAEQ